MYPTKVVDYKLCTSTKTQVRRPVAKTTVMAVIT